MVERVEYVRYTRHDLALMAKWNARAQLIGPIYFGHIGEQEVRWRDDDSVEILTHHTPADTPTLIPPSTSAPAPLVVAGTKERP